MQLLHSRIEIAPFSERMLEADIISNLFLIVIIKHVTKLKTTGTDGLVFFSPEI